MFVSTVLKHLGMQIQIGPWRMTWNQPAHHFPNAAKLLEARMTLLPHPAQPATAFQAEIKIKQVDVGFVNQNSGFINQRFDNQGSTTKVRQLKTAVSSTKVRQPKSWIRQPRGSSTKKVGFVNQKRRIHQPRFVNQGSSTKNTDSSTKDSPTKRLDSSTKNGGFINQGSSTKNTDSSTKDSSTKRLDSSKNGGFEGSGTFLACLEVEKLSLTCRCCVFCS